MININDPGQAAKLFSELDPAEDPLGRAALKSVDFRNLGMFFPNKEYASAKEAAQQLEANRSKVNRLLDQAREKQIHNFRGVVGESVKQDHDLCIMPYIRVNQTKSQSHR